MKLPVNIEIATTHIIKGAKQTLVAALGVALGVAIYLFMNSLSSGFSKFSRDNIFDSSAHLKIFRDDALSKTLNQDTNTLNIIVNPQITTQTKNIINPNQLIDHVKKEPYITNAIAQIDYTVFYNRGKTQVKGAGIGVDILEYDAMFNTRDKVIAGSLEDLKANGNGVILGSGIAKKLSLNLGDNVSMTSSYGVNKVLKIVGIVEFGNKKIDESRSYVNTNIAQQFLKEGPSYVNTIYANTIDPEKSKEYMQNLQTITNYSVEDWKTTNADIVSQDNTRATMMNSISASILVLAGFIIYNILSSTISQKIDDIAILKATGFSSRDVIIIFILEALLMGVVGTLIGLALGSVLVFILSKVYMGGPVGYFPISFELWLYLQSFFLGLLMTLLAGYFPARNASKVDPVEIFRK
ncbi:MAG: ABC transporter permease [Flavobacteriales bacterium]|nr:ABC transporter permease [Flavobacteriales bacterium]